MSYLGDKKIIDKKIEYFASQNVSISRNTKYLIKHTKKNIVAPLKEIIWNGRIKSKAYKNNANGRAAYEWALKLGYVSEINPWEKESFVKPTNLYNNQDYFILRFIDSASIQNKYLNMIKHEQALRELIGRPNERNDIFGEFGEFLYCKLFGVSSTGKLNTPGYDLVDPVSGRKIQVKVARKSKNNSSAISVKKRSVDQFDTLSIFWLSPERKIMEFIELSNEEVREFETTSDTIEKISPRNIKNSILKRSRKKIMKALNKHNLTDLLEKAWET